MEAVLKLRSRFHIFLLVPVLVLALAACDLGPAPAAPTPAGTAVAQQTPVEPSPQAADTATVDNGVEPTSTDDAPTETPSGPAENPTPADAVPSPTGTIVDATNVEQPTVISEEVPTATTVVEVSTGDEVTVLDALAELKVTALEEMPDARLAMVVNSKPNQQKILLGTALGDPNVNEVTPGGLGRNWTLIAVSPSQERAMAFSLDGTVVDLTAEDAVPDELLANFGSASAAELDLTRLDPANLVDSDEIARIAGPQRMREQAGIALIATDALGMGQLPTPEAGGPPPKLAYELFGTAVGLPFVIFDAKTGAIVLDSDQ